MGLKNHTAICILREQRRKAEDRSHLEPKLARLKTTDRIKFSLLEPGNSALTEAFKPFLNRKEQDESLRLLQRLRQALKPLQQMNTPESTMITNEYMALQDELQRLTSHSAQLRETVNSAELLEEELPLAFSGEKNPVHLPYHFVSIQGQGKLAKLPIVRLEASPSDLRAYKLESLPNTAKQPRNLTLVKEIPDGPTLLIGENCELGQVIADLTQQSLHEVRPPSTTVPIPQDIALSLLNS